MIIEQFGAGLGLTVYVVWLAHCTKGEHSTFTYSIGTAITGLLVGDDRMVYRFLAGVCGLSFILPSCGNIGSYQLYSDLLYPCNKRDRTTKKDGLTPIVH